jgi:hypothetical protein
MPKWIHDRAKHLKAKNPEMSESMAFAVATNQHKKLEKTAEVPVEEEEGRPNLRKFLLGWAGDAGGRILNDHVGAQAATRVAGEVAENPGLAEALKQRLREEAEGVQFHDSPVPGGNFFVMSPGSAQRAYGMNVNAGDVITDPHTSPGFLAHELGHGDVAKAPLGKIIQNPFTLALGNLSRGVGFVSGAASGMTDDPTLQALGIAAPAVAAAPQLVYEAAASLLGLRRMRSAGASSAQLAEAAKQLGLAFGSYGARAASGTGLALATQGMVSGARRSLEEPDAVPEEKIGALADDIRSALEGQTTGPFDRLKSSIKSEAVTLSENPMPTKYLATKFTEGMPLNKIGHVEFNAFIDELIKDAEVAISGAPTPSRFQKFVSGVKGEAGPAVGATLGAGLAKAYGIDPLAGAAAGYGIGAIPEVVHALTHKIATTDPELRETGRQRAVTSLAADAHRDAGRRGERAGGAVGAVGGALGGAALGRKLIGGAPGTIAGLVGGYVAGGRVGKEIGSELDIKKNAFALSGYAGQPAQNPPGMRLASPAPPVTVPALATKNAARVGPFKRIGELYTGSRVKQLDDLAMQQFSSVEKHTSDASRAAEAIGRLKKAPDLDTNPLGRPALKHVEGKRQESRRFADDAFKKNRGFRDEQRKEQNKVDFTRAGTVGAALGGGASLALGLHKPPEDKKKEAFQTSQYSGPLSYGPFKMTSGIPPFRSPAMTKGDPTVAEKPWMVGGEKIAGGMNTALDSMGPAGRLTQTQRVGAPKTTGVAGPSIADIAKPTGFGKPLAGATKSF